MRILGHMTFSVDTVFLWVTDLSKSVDWYSRFGVDAGEAYGDWQTMKVDGSTAFALHRGNRLSGAATGGVAFGVEDLDVQMSRLAGIGIEPVDREITETGVARFTTFQDPDGNDVQLLQRLR